MGCDSGPLGPGALVDRETVLRSDYLFMHSAESRSVCGMPSVLV